MKTKPKTAAVKTAVFIVFFLYAVSLIYPFLWMTLNALKTKAEFFGSVFKLPEKAQWKNVSDAFFNFRVTVGAGETARDINMAQMFLTSVLLTSAVTFAEVFLSACTAYTVCFYKFPFRRAMYAVVIFALVVPLVGTLPAMYKFMKDVSLLNTIPGILFLYANGLGFSFLLLFGSFKSLSWSYAEAASIDGAGHFRTFFQIMLPLSAPAVTATAIVAAIGYWNDYATPVVFLERYPTLAVGVNTLIIKMKYENNYPLMFSCMIIAVVPIVAFFACFQKVIMKNMVAGGLKG
ncbi:MAG: carbohydrate ABC transporter permease [Clostridiales bacterium]|jgi:ABC-type glycerol-3-phosphate transport system permease component|nr:carbohydrate ABC transporter permease [Clostridiales bacterium]